MSVWTQSYPLICSIHWSPYNSNFKTHEIGYQSHEGECKFADKSCQDKSLLLIRISSVTQHFNIIEKGEAMDVIKQSTNHGERSLLFLYIPGRKLSLMDSYQTVQTTPWEPPSKSQETLCGSQRFNNPYIWIWVSKIQPTILFLVSGLKT